MNSIYDCKPLKVPEEWQEYARRKAEWIASNPSATTEQYDAAIRCIVDELGI